MLDLDPGQPQLHSFWIDQYGTRIQQLGHARLADRVTIDGDSVTSDFTAIYTRRERPVAALLVGATARASEARRLLATAA